MDALVAQLSRGKHAVSASRYQDASELSECIGRGFVLIKFAGTRGGTELGLRINVAETVTANADFKSSLGIVHLVGELSLNYETVRCVADIDLESLSGEGHLEPVATTAVTS